MTNDKEVQMSVDETIQKLRSALDVIDEILKQCVEFEQGCNGNIKQREFLQFLIDGLQLVRHFVANSAQGGSWHKLFEESQIVLMQSGEVGRVEFLEKVHQVLGELAVQEAKLSEFTTRTEARFGVIDAILLEHPVEIE
jgi:hypothetical protein